MSRFAVLTSLLILLVLFVFQNALEQISKNLGEYSLILVASFFPIVVARVSSPSFGIKTNFFLLIKAMFFRKLRVSFSYLIRIKVDEKYLLVRSGKVKESNLKYRYQPPGGAYHIYRYEAVRDRFSLYDDNMKDSDKHDIRKRMKNPYMIFKFIDWFEAGMEREVTPNREFYEELVLTNVLPLDLFHNAKFEKVKSVHIQIKWSKYNKINEYKLFDIFELRLTQKQESFIRNLMTSKSDLVRFLDYDEIMSLSGKEIKSGWGVTEHSVHILE